jgi:hypothetical protein
MFELMFTKKSEGKYFIIDYQQGRLFVWSH